MESYLPLRRLLECAKVHWKPWVVAAAAMGVVVLIASLFNMPYRNTVSASVSFSFEGVERGVGPSGGRFDADEIKSAALVERAAASIGLELEEAQTEEIRSAIIISGILPRDVASRLTDYSSIYGKDGVSVTSAVQDTAYYPTQYTISFYYAVPGLTAAQGTQFLTALLDAYREYFYSVYGYNTAFDNALRSFDYNAYDYTDAVGILQNNLSELASYLRWLSSLNTTRFVSASTGYTFSDLAAAIDTLQTENIAWLNSYIISNSLTRSRTELSDYYRYRIRQYQLNISLWNSRLENLNQLLNSYVKTNALVVGLGTGENTGVDISQPSEMYDQLVQDKVEYQASIAEMEKNAAHYESLLERLQETSGAGKLDTLQENFSLIDRQINTILDNTGKTAAEYFETVRLERAFQIQKRPAKSGFLVQLVKTALFPGAGAEFVIFGLFLLDMVRRAGFRPTLVSVKEKERKKTKAAQIGG